MSIVTAVAVVTVIGLLGAAILVVAAHFMHVEEDPRVGEVLGVLPGANCGACGYNSCRVKDAEHCVCQARIALCTATKNVISNALTLLKITVPESM